MNGTPGTPQAGAEKGRLRTYFLVDKQGKVHGKCQIRLDQRDELQAELIGGIRLFRKPPKQNV